MLGVCSVDRELKLRTSIELALCMGERSRDDFQGSDELGSCLVARYGVSGRIANLGVDHVPDGVGWPAKVLGTVNLASLLLGQPIGMVGWRAKRVVDGGVVAVLHVLDLAQHQRCVFAHSYAWHALDLWGRGSVRQRHRQRELAPPLV